MNINAATSAVTAEVKLSTGRTITIKYLPYGISFDDQLAFDRKLADAQKRIDDADHNAALANKSLAHARRKQLEIDEDADDFGSQLDESYKAIEKAKALVDQAVQAAIDATTESFALTCELMLSLIVDWTYTDPNSDSNAIVPLTPTSLRTVPTGIVSDVMRGMREDKGEQSGGRSRNTSRKTAS